MFDKMSQMKKMLELQNAAKKMKKELMKKVYQKDNEFLKLEMNGSYEILSLKIKEDLSKEELEKKIKEAFNDLTKQLEKDLKNQMSHVQKNLLGDLFK